MTDIQLLVIDLDGTLLNSDHTMSERNREAIEKAIAQGTRVVIATGKTRKSAEDVLKTLKLTTSGVFNQGTLVTRADGTVRKQEKLDPAAARRAIQYAQQQGFEVIAYSRDRLLARHNDAPVSDIAQFGEPMPEAVGNLVNQVNSLTMNKLIIVGGTPRKLKALRWQLTQQIGMHVDFTEANVLTSLEVLPKNSSKVAGVKTVLKDMNIKAENVLAIGDADNDIGLLELAGIGVAMGNATDALKAVADEVTGTNDEDGVAQVIEKHVLTEPESEADDNDAVEPSDEADTTDQSDDAATDTETTDSTEETTA